MAEPGESLLRCLSRGGRRRCPRCGAPGMFSGYLSVAARCRRCALDFETIRSDDVPPYFTVVIVGHLVVPTLLLAEQLASPPTWLLLAVSLPLTLILTLSLLPFVKGAVMGAIWNTRGQASLTTSHQ